jgi:hypothetical protein
MNDINGIGLSLVRKVHLQELLVNPEAEGEDLDSQQLQQSPDREVASEMVMRVDRVRVFH